MEAIDVQNRSFVVRWLKVQQGDTITYQLKPLKRSVDAGIYKRRTTINDDAFERDSGASSSDASPHSPSKSNGGVGRLNI